MRVTRLVTPQSHLTLATHKYWVGAFYEGNIPVLVTVFVTSTLAQRVEELKRPEYTEFRLIKGFPIQSHAIRFKTKCQKRNRNIDKLMRGTKTTEAVLPIGKQNTVKKCRMCKVNKVCKPFTMFCKSCCMKLVQGHPKSGVHYVYGLYTATDQLLYIGVTGSPYVRVHDHKKSKKFHHMELVRSFSNRRDADDFEKFAIQNITPPLNILVLPSEIIGYSLEDLDAFGKTSDRKRQYPIRKTLPPTRS